jgi:hypothetical protein
LTLKTRLTDLYIQKQKYARPNIDTSHRCVFRCPQCIRQRVISQPQIKRSFDLEEHNFKKIMDYYEGGVTFCGQISDPIYHPKFLNLLKMCDEDGSKVRIATVGSGKSDAWWDEAYSYGVGENAWYFGVDGIDKKSELYRIGSNFDDVWERMKQGRDLGHVIVWQYIIFGYNEHEVDRAIEIAREENFSLLFINTNRGFEPKTVSLRPNVDFKLTKPDKKYQAERLKTEWWGHGTAIFKRWADTKENTMLIGGNRVGPNRLWEQESSEKEFKRNKRELGPDWYYYNKKIKYKFNSNGFRAPELHTIDWANSVVVLGDSYTMGDGNPIEDIATSLLQDMLGMPVINLGISGTGIDRSCWNSLILHEGYQHPRAVVQLWSSMHRYAESDEENKLGGYKHYSPSRKGFCPKHNWSERNKMYVLADRVLWKDKLPYYEASVFDVTAEELEVDYLSHLDLGRDLKHWGRESNIAAAETIATNLKKQGL